LRRKWKFPLRNLIVSFVFFFSGVLSMEEEEEVAEETVAGGSKCH